MCPILKSILFCNLPSGVPSFVIFSCPQCQWQVLNNLSVDCESSVLQRCYDSITMLFVTMHISNGRSNENLASANLG
jgi:hypothetical protein